MEVADVRGRAAEMVARLSPAERYDLAVAAMTIRLSTSGLDTSYRQQVLATLTDLAPTMSKAVHAVLRPTAKGAS